MAEVDLGLDSVFTEPPRPPTPEPTIAEYYRERRGEEGVPNSIRIRLVGAHPLWGHYLWNASRAFASYLDANPSLVKNKRILELGAGGALPSIISALNGASKVVITDYPDADLIKNVEYNVEMNVSPQIRDNISVQGYIWGHPVQPLLDDIPPSPDRKFDIIILSDLIFNHSQHDAMLNTCEAALKHPTPDPSPTPNQPPAQTPSVLVFYTHHRPRLAHRDMEFFEKARNRGWICEEIFTKVYPPMFPDDPGELEVRSTVHGWRLVRR